MQHGLQDVAGDSGVGEDEAEHRRHVGRDHAGAFAEAVDGDVGGAEFDRAGREFCVGIGGHDGAGGGFGGVCFC